MVQKENLVATSILDDGSAEICRISRELRASNAKGRDYLRACHAEITRRVSPIYTVDELQPASVTLRKGRGSCSQRMAVLEALARAAGIGSRVRVLWVSGIFWYPRFSAVPRFFIPRRVLLLWPHFWLEDHWVGIEEVHSSLQRLASDSTPAFKNNGETLFDAVSHLPIDFQGVTCAACGDKYDLSRFLLAEDESANTRDEALARYHLFQWSLRGRVFELIFGGRSSC